MSVSLFSCNKHLAFQITSFPLILLKVLWKKTLACQIFNPQNTTKLPHSLCLGEESVSTYQGWPIVTKDHKIP